MEMAGTDPAGAIPRTDHVEQLRQFILERWPAFAATASRHQWPSEQLRWHELAFCLVSRVGAPELSVSTARVIIDVLARLDLLEVETLTGLTAEDGTLDRAHADAILIEQVMKRLGLSPDAAQAAIVTLWEAATSLERHHDGKVQRYLREYGERMLDQADRHFAFTRLPKADVGWALTHWLQNVLSMPLALREPAMEDLADAFGLSTAELVTVADELDVNVALLDDMVTGTALPTAAETAPPEPA